MLTSYLVKILPPEDSDLNKNIEFKLGCVFVKFFYLNNKFILNTVYLYLLKLSARNSSGTWDKNPSKDLAFTRQETCFAGATFYI